MRTWPGAPSRLRMQSRQWLDGATGRTPRAENELYNASGTPGGIVLADVSALPVRRGRQWLRVGTIVPVVLCGRAVGEFAVTACLVAAQRADALHVPHQQGLRAREVRDVDAERLQHFRHFVGAVRSGPNQPLEIIRRNPEVVRDQVEIGPVHAADFAQLAAVLEPVGELVDQVLDGGIAFVLGGHGATPVTLGSAHASTIDGKGCCGRSNSEGKRAARVR